MPLPDIEQKAVKLNPSIIKPILRPIYHRLRSTGLYRKITRLARPAKSREEVHQFWRQPWDSTRTPRSRLLAEKRSRFLVEVVNRHCSPGARILEIGCSAGRNLNHLFLAGFRSLEGIEISENDIQLLKETYLEMAQYAKIYHSPVEDIIQSFENDAFDLVFTMGVLKVIHPDSEWIFPEIVRITKTNLITSEDETSVSGGIFPRNYKRIFEPIGMKQIEWFDLSGLNALEGSLFLRVFKKVTS